MAQGEQNASCMCAAAFQCYAHTVSGSMLEHLSVSIISLLEEAQSFKQFSSNL
jgi:hypothetical protein